MDDPSPTPPRFLPVRYRLDHYEISDVLGSGGFGVTYLAEHVSLGKMFAIKEYFPQASAYRDATQIHPHSHAVDEYQWGLDRFLAEARLVAQFNHSAIVSVQHVFEANNTAYLVMDYVEGMHLADWASTLPLRPTQSQLDRICSQLLDALEVVHSKQLLHRDISPDNIIVRPNGLPVLLDFGAARADIGERSQLMSAIVKSGYSPPEQYT